MKLYIKNYRYELEINYYKMMTKKIYVSFLCINKRRHESFLLIETSKYIEKRKREFQPWIL